MVYNIFINLVINDYVKYIKRIRIYSNIIAHKNKMKDHITDTKYPEIAKSCIHT